MFSTVSVVYRNLPIRICAIAIFFFGFSGAAISPFQSAIAIRELGISDAAYSLLIFLAAVINVSASVVIGILSDRLGEYRRPLIIVSLFGVTGCGVIYFGGGQISFIIGTLFFLPIAGTMNSLIFANVRAFSRDLPKGELVSVNSAVRAMISLSWVLVPGLVGFVLAGAASMLPAYLLAMLAALACYGLFQFFLPGVTAEPKDTPEVAFLTSLARVVSLPVLIRLLAMSMITSMLHINAAVLPLIVTEAAGGTVADVGVIIGIVAVLEIIFIVFWGWIEPRMGAVLTISAGAGLYALYLFLLGHSTTPFHVYALCLISGLGAAAIISLPITYLQNLIADKAGLGSSLIAVNLFISGGLSSLLFGLGTAISDYSGTAVLGAGAGLAGAVLVVALDGRRGTAGISA